jgi:hypothetical protein
MPRVQNPPKFTPGEKVHSWTIEKIHYKTKRSNGALDYRYWAICDCGIQSSVSQRLLIENQSTKCRSCAAKRYQEVSDNKIGNKFGKLVVLSDSGKRAGRAKLYNCICECGETTVTRSDRLRIGSPSCGCDLSDKLGIGRFNSHKNCIYRYYINNAKKRGIAFDLTLDQVISIAIQHCSYCGEAPIYKYLSHNTNGKIKITGIDRVDNLLGYTDSNCVPCCGDCNKMKAGLTVDQFKKKIVAIHRRFYGK